MYQLRERGNGEREEKDSRKGVKYSKMQKSNLNVITPI